MTPALKNTLGIYHYIPNIPPIKIYECETSFDRKTVINQIYLLSKLAILHVYANEAQHISTIERLSNNWRFSKYRIYYFQERHYTDSSDISLQSQDLQPLL